MPQLTDRSHSVAVSTEDSDSFIPSSNLGDCTVFLLRNHPFFFFVLCSLLTMRQPFRSVHHVSYPLNIFIPFFCLLMTLREALVRCLPHKTVACIGPPGQTKIRQSQPSSSVPAPCVVLVAHANKLKQASPSFQAGRFAIYFSKK